MPGNDPPAAVVRVADESQLDPLAERLVAVLPRPAFVGLSGDLGAGKTTFVKAVAAACGLDRTEVISPTFGLIHEFSLPPLAGLPDRLVHADLYRLAGPDELGETGWDDAIAGDAWVFVEWPERLGTLRPADRIDVAIAIESATARRITLTPHGPRAAAAVAALGSPAA